MKRKIGLSTYLLQSLYGDKRAIELAKEAGADSVDLDLTCYSSAKEGCVYSLGEKAVEEYFNDLGAYARSIGMEIGQTHGRIKGFINDKEKDDIEVRDGRLDCIATRALGAKYCVMHTTTTIWMGADAPEELMYKLNYDMFTRILPYAVENDVIIATETFGDATGKGCIDFFGDITHFEKGFEQIVSAHPEFKNNFCVCMDTGHSNKSTRFEGNPPVGEVIRRLGDKIKVLHLHDNNTLVDQHRVPKAGNIDWSDVMKAFSEIGFDGIYNLEINLKNFGGADFALEEAKFAIKVMRRLFATEYGE